MAEAKDDIVLSIRGMCKSFGRNRVLDHINLDVKRGTVMGLMGENGAGKSTMMKCLFGTYQKDEGKIFLNAHVRRGAAQRVLKQPPDDAAAVMLACKGNVLAIQQNTALVHIKAACDGVEKRGLARAVRADNGDEIALVEME